MAQGQPVEAKTRARVVALLHEGMSRNDIARDTGLSGFTVSKIAREEGISFERASSTAVAKEARAADFSDIRARLAREMSAVAFQETARARAPYKVFAFGGSDNTYREHELDLPPAEAVQRMQTTAAMAFDKATKVIEGQQDPTEVGAKAMLSSLGEYLGIPQ